MADHWVEMVPSAAQINIIGFLQPIKDARIFKAGSTVPVKFQLKKADGAVVQAKTSPPWFTPQNGGPISVPVDESLFSSPVPSGSTYRWDSSSQQYIYNWNTKGLAGGYWYRIYTLLDDGKIHFMTVGLK